MTTVRISGAFLNDTTRRFLVDSMIDEMKWEVARQGYANARTLMDRYFKNPTPYYETQVIVERQGDDVVVHDRGIVYGPWLEGVSYRNQITRFKGYHHWRQATQQTEQEADRLIRHVARRYVSRLNR